MTIKCWVLTVGVLLAGCANKSDHETTVSSKPARVSLYQRGDGRDSIVCMRTPDRDVCASDDELGYQFSDCSNDEFECVFDYYNVFAVPKLGVTAGQQYDAFGATLTVERCFGDAGQCQVAMITSMCTTDADCPCRLADIGKTKTVFYYSSELGITAFYTTVPKNDKEDSRSAVDAAELDDAIPLRTYVLASDSGFLREHWNIRTAKSRTQCAQ